MTRTAALAGVFCLSGACAVIFETLWFHQASLLLGHSVLAASLVLSAFMAGMALGNGLAARIQRIRDGIRAYALLEVAVACFGFGLVWSMPRLAGTFATIAQAMSARPAPMNALRFVIAFALLLPPSAAMDMSLPLLVRAVARWDRSFGRSLGLLYGANTLGAAVGGVVAEIWLVPWFGIVGGALCTAAGNLIAAGWRCGSLAYPHPRCLPLMAAKYHGSWHPSRSCARSVFARACCCSAWRWCGCAC